MKLIELIIEGFDSVSDYEEFINRNLDLICLELPMVEEEEIIDKIILIFHIIENLEVSKRKNANVILDLYNLFNLKVEKEVQEEIVFENLKTNPNDNYIKFLEPYGLIGISDIKPLRNDDKIATIPPVHSASKYIDISLDYYHSLFLKNRTKILNNNLYPEYGNLTYNYAVNNPEKNNNAIKNNISSLLPSLNGNMFISNPYYQSLIFKKKQYSTNNSKDIILDNPEIKAKYFKNNPLDFNLDFDYVLNMRRNPSFKETPENRYYDVIEKKYTNVPVVYCEHEDAITKVISSNYNKSVLEDFLIKFVVYIEETPVCKQCGSAINYIAKHQTVEEGGMDLLIINNTSRLVIKQKPYVMFLDTYISLEEIVKSLDLYFKSFSIIDLIHIYRILIDEMVFLNDKRKELEKKYQLEIRNSDLFFVRIKEGDNFLEIYKNEKFTELKVLNNFIVMLLLYVISLPISNIYYIKNNILKKSKDISAEEIMSYIVNRYLGYQKIYSKNVDLLLKIYIEESTEEVKNLFLSFKRKVHLLDKINNIYEKRFNEIKSISLNRGDTTYVPAKSQHIKDFKYPPLIPVNLYFSWTYNPYTNTDIRSSPNTSIKVDFPKKVEFEFPKEFYYNGEKIIKLHVTKDGKYLISVKSRIYPIIKFYDELVNEYNSFRTDDTYINALNGGDNLWFTSDLNFDHVCNIDNKDIFNLYDGNNVNGILDRGILISFFSKQEALKQP